MKEAKGVKTRMNIFANIFLVLMMLSGAAFAVPPSVPDVEEVRGGNGIRAWLVHDDSLPLITIRMAWRGGGVHEAAHEVGITAMMASLLTQGAGAYDASAFADKLARRAIALNFAASHDAVYGNMRCLSAMQAECFALLRLAITAPRFDAAAIKRVVRERQSQFKQIEQNSERLAAREFSKLAFGAHRYGTSALGTPRVVQGFTAAQVSAQHKRVLARDNLHIAVIGDISATTLRAVLNSVFDALPASADLPHVKKAVIGGAAKANHVFRKGGQTSIVFGTRGIAFDDPQFFAAHIANHILGGGTLSSRLSEAIRNQRGLAYGVFSHFATYDYGAVWQGFVASRDETAAEALAIAVREMTAMAAGDISEEDVQATKDYLTGAFALRFDSGAKIARQLLDMQLLGRDIDYLVQRNAMVNGVSLEAVRQAAHDFFKPQDLWVSSVGGADPLAELE